MNILHLINVCWYNACAYYALELAAAQSALGHRVIIAGDADTPVMEKANQRNLEVNTDLRLSSYFPHLLQNMRKLVEIVNSKNIDAVIAHRGEAHVAAFLAKRFMGFNALLIRVRGDMRLPRNDVFNRFLYSGVTNGIICTTEKLKTSYKRAFSIGSDRIIVIPAGIDFHHFSQPIDTRVIRERLGLKNEDKVVTILGRLSPVKGHEVFIKMAGEISKTIENVHFLIAGKECELTRADLKSMMERYAQKAQFSMIGEVEDVREILNVTDVAVIPSLDSEMIARTALELMAAGRPIVASDINALSETVDSKQGGYLISPSDADGFAEAVLVLLKDEKKLNEFGAYNRRKAEKKYASEIWAESSINFIDRISRLGCQ